MFTSHPQHAKAAAYIRQLAATTLAQQLADRGVADPDTALDAIQRQVANLFGATPETAAA